MYPYVYLLFVTIWLLLVICLISVSFYSYDGADDCVLNIDSKKLVAHEIFMEKQNMMLNQSKMYPMQQWIDSIIDRLVQKLDFQYLSSIRPSVALESAYKDIRSKLCHLTNWDWFPIFYSFVQLQNLPFNDAHTCSNPDCPGIILDGTFQAQVKTQNFAFPTSVTSPIRNQVVKFQDHTLIKSKLLRDQLTTYVYFFVTLFLI